MLDIGDCSLLYLALVEPDDGLRVGRNMSF